MCRHLTFHHISEWRPAFESDLPNSVFRKSEIPRPFYCRAGIILRIREVFYPTVRVLQGEELDRLANAFVLPVLWILAQTEIPVIVHINKFYKTPGTWK